MRETIKWSVQVSALQSDADGKVWFPVPLGLEIVSVTLDSVGLFASGDPLGPKSYYLNEADLPTDGCEHDLVITFERPDPEFFSCFISHSSKDDEFVLRLHADLKNERIPCWYAPEDMKIGDRTRSRIDEVIRLYEKLLLVLSEHSVNSAWVEQEVETALAEERETETQILFPIRLDDTVMESKRGWAAYIKNTRHIGDFRNWKDHDAYQKSLQRVVRDLTIDQTPATRAT